MSIQAAENDLASILEQVLPGQKLKRFQLPQAPAIQLLLFDDAGMHRALDSAESEAVYRHTPFWLFCWASGQALAAWLLQNPEYVRDRAVLDFGSGSGVVAIAAALCGARHVVAYDEDSSACTASRVNANLNAASVEVVSSLQESTLASGEYDVVLAADVLYDAENLPLLDFFLGLGQHVLVADSRLKTMPHPDYQLLATLASETLPDMGELALFSSVKLYRGERGVAGS